MTLTYTYLLTSTRLRARPTVIQRRACEPKNLTYVSLRLVREILRCALNDTCVGRSLRCALNDTYLLTYLPPPYFVQHPHDVATEDFTDVVVGVVVLHQPTHNVGELFGRIFDTVDELNLLKLLRAVGGFDGQLTCQGM